MPVRLRSASTNFTEEFGKFLHAKRDVKVDVEEVVSDILKDVRVHGDEALFKYTSRFDRFKLTPDNVRISSQRRRPLPMPCFACTKFYREYTCSTMTIY